MKIEFKKKKYNINIEEKTLYEDGKPINKEPFNEEIFNHQWIVIRIALENSKQAIREMFETAFDNKYGKPVFSVK